MIVLYYISKSLIFFGDKNIMQFLCYSIWPQKISENETDPSPKIFKVTRVFPLFQKFFEKIKYHSIGRCYIRILNMSYIESFHFYNINHYKNNI